MTTITAITIGQVYDHLKECSYDLYPYQKEGVEWMINREKRPCVNPAIKGGLLCDEPGLGKTIQTCALMYGNRVDVTLLVVPGSVIHQWEEAFDKILPMFGYYTHHGPGRLNYDEIVELIDDGDIKIIVTTLHMLYNRQNDEETVLHKVMANYDNGRIVIDEVHTIRNQRTKAHGLGKRCGAINIKAENRWGLTGTPVQNSKSDLKSLYAYIGLDRDWFRMQWGGDDIDALMKLNTILMKRRTKDMVKECNERFEMPELVQKVYKLHFKDDKERKAYQRGHKLVEPLEQLLRKRQASIHPEISLSGYRKKFRNDTISNMDEIAEYLGDSTKTNMLVEMISSRVDKANCLVFTDFKLENKIIGHKLSKKDIKYRVYDGSTSLEARTEILSEFEDIDTISQGDIQAPRVLLIQIKAGSVGLNLQKFTEVFLVSRNWNPSNEIQAIARAHRIGQKNKVYVHRFHLEDNKKSNTLYTIDQHIESIQMIKRDTMCELLKDKTLIDMGKKLDIISGKTTKQQTRPRPTP